MQNPGPELDKLPQEDEEIAKDLDTEDGQMAEVEGDVAPPLPPLELASMSFSLIASTPSPLVRNIFGWHDAVGRNLSYLKVYLSVQGDHSGCLLGVVDINTKFAF